MVPPDSLILLAGFILAHPAGASRISFPSEEKARTDTQSCRSFPHYCRFPTQSHT